MFLVISKVDVLFTNATYSTSEISRNNQVLFNDLLVWIFRQLGIHHIRTKLFSIPLPSLNKLYKECLQSSFLDPSSREYKLNSIILDIANCRLFKPVNSSLSNDTPDRFLHLKFANKGIDAININNILHDKHVRKSIPPYFKYQANPKIFILIHVSLHPNCSIINNVYKTGASLIMGMIVLLVLALRRNSSTNQLDI